MGRITIFTVDNCPNCKHVKYALEFRRLPFVEISLSLYPEKRNDMFLLSDRWSVPQVFFNTRHVGGVVDTMELLHEWDTDISRFNSAYDRYEYEIGCHPDPMNRRMMLPQHEPTLQYCSPGMDDDCLIKAPPNGRLLDVMNATELLKKVIPASDIEVTNEEKSIRKVFTQQEASTAFVYQYDIGFDQAEEFFNHLRVSQLFGQVKLKQDFLSEAQLGHSVNKEAISGASNDVFSIEPLNDGEEIYYRLQCFETPHILNSYRKWNKSKTTAIKTVPDVSNFIIYLYTLMGNLISSLTNNDGKINYRMAPKDENFPALENAVSQLQLLDLDCIKSDTIMTAFALNVYNLMMKYAFMKIGIASNKLEKHEFLEKIKFDVGGELFSFMEWYNGILRANLRVPTSRKIQFGKSDKRKRLALKNCNHMIHFCALHRFAENSPPIPYLTMSSTKDSIGNSKGCKSSKWSLKDELEIMAYAFCENEDNVQIQYKDKEVLLSRMFRVYKCDFDVKCDQDLLKKYVYEFLRGTKRLQLERLLSLKKPFKIKFKPDENWACDASEFIPFDSNVLFVDGKKKGKGAVGALRRLSARFSTGNSNITSASSPNESADYADNYPAPPSGLGRRNKSCGDPDNYTGRVTKSRSGGLSRLKNSLFSTKKTNKAVMVGQ